MMATKRLTGLALSHDLLRDTKCHDDVDQDLHCGYSAFYGQKHALMLVIGCGTFCPIRMGSTHKTNRAKVPVIFIFEVSWTCS